VRSRDADEWTRLNRRRYYDHVIFEFDAKRIALPVDAVDCLRRRSRQCLSRRWESRVGMSRVQRTGIQLLLLPHTMARKHLSQGGIQGTGHVKAKGGGNVRLQRLMRTADC
jgi:hypothetical protein